MARRGGLLEWPQQVARAAGRLIGAAVALVKRAQPEALPAAVQNGRAAVVGLPRRDFETLIGCGFRHRGFAVSAWGAPGRHGDVDLLLTRGSERSLVQYKHGRALQVSVREVRELYGVMAAEKVAAGIVVTSGTFTKNARKFAAGRNIELIDAAAGLDALLKDGRSAVAATLFHGVAANGPETAPYCPACKTPMVVRTAKRGGQVVSSFWGCPQYPECSQTMVRVNYLPLCAPKWA